APLLRQKHAGMTDLYYCLTGCPPKACGNDGLLLLFNWMPAKSMRE
ncbi:MAG: hypothetical protein ACI9MF_001632, partial [Gammaproteobacteria bacterium]